MEQRKRRPWTWNDRVKKALSKSKNLNKDEIEKIMDKIMGCGSVTFKVAKGKAEEVAKIIGDVYPDKGYCASYHVSAKSDETVDLYSRPWDMVF